jgi:prepilin-type N-terminal cleavage/methylation domain-containing protein
MRMPPGGEATTAQEKTKNKNHRVESMKLKQNRTRTRAAFTLIEMIGVLAVIAILAALLIPKVFAAINSAKISNTSTSINTVKTAAIDHYAKFGSLNVDGTTTPPTALTLPVLQYDQVLLSEGFLDKLFQVKIGDGIISNANTRVQLVAATTGAADGLGSRYDLDGNTGNGVASDGNDTTGSYVLEAVITAVAVEDARDLNRIMDGTDGSLGELGTGEDIAGRVTYAVPTGGFADVFVYLTHR